MNASKGLQKLLADFIFRDCRIESHPKLVASYVFFASDEATLELVAAVSKHPLPFEARRLSAKDGIVGTAWRTGKAIVVSDVNPPDARFQPARFVERGTVKSAVSVPIWNGSSVYGTLSLNSEKKDFFQSEDIGRLQLLGALIAFAHARARKKVTNTDAAADLGRALAAVRAELGLTQDELAIVA